MDEQDTLHGGEDKRGCIVVASRNPRMGLMESHLALLEESNEIVRLEFDCSEEEMLHSLARADVLVSICMAPITAQMMDAAPNLKGVVNFGSGYNHIDVSAATERGIYVSKNPGANAEAVAELTFSMILNLARKTYRVDPLIRAGKWQLGTAFPFSLSGMELCKKTLGIIGLGRIGKRVARIGGGGFEMQVLACDPYVSAEAAQRVGATLVELETIFREADILTLHVPMNAETEGLVSAERLALMKPTAYLINTCRGPVIDEKALIEALRERRIAGAGLDVFAVEPLVPDHPLLKFDNVVLTPHFGGRTAKAKEKQSAGVVRRVLQILAGEIPDNLVNEAVLERVRPRFTQG